MEVCRARHPRQAIGNLDAFELGMSEGVINTPATMANPMVFQLVNRTMDLIDSVR